MPTAWFRGVGGQAAAHHLPELLPPEPVGDPTVVFLEAYRHLAAICCWAEQGQKPPTASVPAAAPQPHFPLCLAFWDRRSVDWPGELSVEFKAGGGR
jgi:hypothetical protein